MYGSMCYVVCECIWLYVSMCYVSMMLYVLCMWLVHEWYVLNVYDCIVSMIVIYVLSICIKYMNVLVM